VDWVWRRIVPLLALGLAAYAVSNLQTKVDRAQGQLDAQREGRRVAREVLCGGLYGVEEAGRLILLGELPPPAPPAPQLSSAEIKTREAYAKSYALVVSRRVLAQGGIRAQDVLNDDGTINCDALSRIATSEEASPTSTP
jgi:hypothetical protein